MRGFFSESVMRKLLSKYTSEERVSFYNDYVQKHLMKKLDIQPCVHILDCTKIPVNLDNNNYENASVVKIDGESMRGYKPGVPRGILDDAGIAEEIVFGTLKTHDLEQCSKMLKNISCFHENDILINDRGFLSREMTNYLKIERKADTYIPARGGGHDGLSGCRKTGYRQRKMAQTSQPQKKRPGNPAGNRPGPVMGK